ncbi:hypothetical protein ACOTFF_21750 [Achromobacter xylosoxidans]
MKQSDLNHLRRLLGWISCDIGQDPAGQQQTMIHIAGKLGIDSIDADAKARLVEGYRRAEAVPVYVRDAVKALEKALAAAGRDPGVVAPRATAQTRANTGFDPGAGAGRAPVLDDVQIERGLAEIGVYVWGQRGEDWLAGVEYLARLLRAGDISPVAKPLQNHPDAAAKGVACRDTPAAPPTLRRDDAGGTPECGHLDAGKRPETRAGVRFVGGLLDADTVVLPPLPAELRDAETEARAYARSAVLANLQRRAALTDEQCIAIYDALNDFCGEVDPEEYVMPYLGWPPDNIKQKAIDVMRAALAAPTLAAQGERQ